MQAARPEAMFDHLVFSLPSLCSSYSFVVIAVKTNNAGGWRPPLHGSAQHAGHVADQTELARPASVTQSRMTQIMNLLHLAPDIQEQSLFLPPPTL
jgi:hypothetical protein